MKNYVFAAFALLFSCVFAQNAAAQSNAATEAELRKMWGAIWQAYEANQLDQVWPYYQENAVEVYPDGSMAVGVAQIKSGYESFSGMLESAPTWTMTPPVVHVLSSDLALMTSEVTTDMKLKGGQQIGGKSTFAVIVRKVKGQWLIVFDSQTPVMTMPTEQK